MSISLEMTDATAKNSIDKRMCFCPACNETLPFEKEGDEHETLDEGHDYQLLTRDQYDSDDWHC